MTLSSITQIAKDLFSAYSQGIVLLCAALAAELAIFRSRIKAAEKKKPLSTVSCLLIAALVMAAYLLASVVITALFQRPSSAEDFLYVCRTIVELNLYKLSILVIFAPLVVWTIWLHGSKKNSSTVLLIIVTLLLLAAGPFLGGKTTSDELLRETVLKACRETSMPYTSRFFDEETMLRHSIAGFKDRDSEVNLQAYLEKPVNPDGSTVAEYTDSGEEGDLLSTNEAKYYLEDVYAVYKKAPESIEGTFDYGMMWFYKGLKDKKAANFDKAAEAFLDMKQYSNAIICYFNSYRTKRNTDTVLKLNDLIEEAPKKSLKKCRVTLGNTMILLQNTYPEDFPALERLHKLFPNNYAIQMSWLMRKLAKDELDDACGEVVNNFLSIENYAASPKVQLAQAYLQLRSGGTVSTKALHKLYRIHPDYFEPEDLIHLSWLFYMSGNNDRAFDYAAAGYAATSVTKMKTGKSSAIGTSLLLPAELYLHDPEQYTMISPLRMLAMTQASMEESAAWFPEKAGVRNEIISLLLADRLGKKDAGEAIAEKSLALFDGDEFVDKLYTARTNYLTGENAACLAACEELLALESISTEEKYNVLLLKADALMGLAKATRSDYEKEGYYEEALKAVKSVKKTGYSYIDCVTRLKVIYENLKETYPDEAKEMERLSSVFAA